MVTGGRIVEEDTMAVTVPKEKILDEVEAKAFNYEKEYRYCSQCTLLALQELFGLESEDAFKAASGFPGGIGRMGSVCGGLIGGVMAIGLLFGRSLEDAKIADPEARLQRGQEIEFRQMQLIKKLFDRFEEEYGSVFCDDIEREVFGRSFDKWDPEERMEKDRMGGHTDKCPMVVGKAVRWAAEVILEEQEKG